MDFDVLLSEKLLQFFDFNQDGYVFYIMFLMIYVILLIVVMAIYVLVDLRRRGVNIFIALFISLFVLIFNLPALVLYLVLRPTKTKDEQEWEELERKFISQEVDDFIVCSVCTSVVRPDQLYCAECGEQYRAICECGKRMELSWKHCAYCGIESPHYREDVTVKKKRSFLPVLAIPPLGLNRQKKEDLAVHTHTATISEQKAVQAVEKVEKVEKIDEPVVKQEEQVLKARKDKPAIRIKKPKTNIKRPLIAVWVSIRLYSSRVFSWSKNTIIIIGNSLKRSTIALSGAMVRTFKKMKLTTKALFRKVKVRSTSVAVSTTTAAKTYKSEVVTTRKKKTKSKKKKKRRR